MTLKQFLVAVEAHNIHENFIQTKYANIGGEYIFFAFSACYLTMQSVPKLTQLLWINI